MEGRSDEGLLALALANNRRGGIVRSGPSSHAIFFRAQPNRLPPLALSTCSSFKKKKLFLFLFFCLFGCNFLR